KNKLSSFTPAEKKVAQYILENPQFVPTMTTSELAQQSQASEASVVRFCKTIGAGSFKMLKVQLAKENSDTEKGINDFSLIHSSDTASSLFHKVTYFNRTSIETTLHTVDKKELEYAVETIRDCKKMAFYGVGGSYPPAVDAQYKMMKIGYHAFVSSDLHYMISLLTTMAENDVLIVFSTSGKTREVIELAEYAKKQKVKVIAITTLQKSPLYKLADHKLCIPHLEEEHRIGTIASRMAQLNIIDTLYLSLFRLMGEKGAEYLHKSRDMIVEQRKRKNT
ncbi:MAG: MurR/RpiR family transcriptional regulator, partial [Bacillus sp. (in: firmicutes)]